MYFRILFLNYLKNFLIIFFSLVFFYVFMDFMLNRAKLPDSINTNILYIFYKMGIASLTMYPLSLVFATILTIMNMIKKNELVSFLSLGYSIKKLLKPVFSGSLIIILFFVSMQLFMNKSFNDRIDELLKGVNYNNTNMFFKFKNKVIYIKKLDVIKKIAYNMKVFTLKNDKLYKISIIKKAYFKNNYWETSNSIDNLITDKKIVSYSSQKLFLRGFKPTILNKLESKQHISLKIAIETLFLLKNTDININFLKTYIYSATIPPLSFLLLSVILFLKSPIHPRISNIGLYIFISIFSVIILWGAFLIFRKMALNNILSADIVFLTPFSILLVLTIYYLRKI